MRWFLLCILISALITVWSAGCTAECEISVEVDPADAADIGGGGLYERGERVTLEVKPDEGYEFRKWVEDGQTVSEDDDYEFEADGDRNLTAVFELKEYAVKVEPNDKEGVCIRWRHL